MKTRHPEQTLADAMTLYQQGVSLTLIEKNSGISRNALVYHLKKLGLYHPRRKNTTSEVQSEVYNLYTKGVPIIGIANQLRLNRNTIARILSKLGIDIRQNHHRYIEIVQQQKYNPFLNLEDPNTQYWLGVMSTDGCINPDRGSGAYSLSTKDEEMAIKFCDFCQLPYTRIGRYLDRRYNTICFQVRDANKNVVETLLSYGLTARKTHSIEIRFALTFNFVLGVIDGDGCVSNTRWPSITIVSASSKFIQQLASFIETKYKVSVTKQNRSTSPIYTLRILNRGLDKVQLVKDLTDGVDYSLSRKRYLLNQFCGEDIV